MTSFVSMRIRMDGQIWLTHKMSHIESREEQRSVKLLPLLNTNYTILAFSWECSLSFHMILKTATTRLPYTEFAIGCSIGRANYLDTIRYWLIVTIPIVAWGDTGSDKQDKVVLVYFWSKASHISQLVAPDNYQSAWWSTIVNRDDSAWHGLPKRLGLDYLTVYTRVTSPGKSFQAASVDHEVVSAHSVEIDSWLALDLGSEHKLS